MRVRKGSSSPSDTAFIQEYIGELQAFRNINIGRKNKIVFTLVGWRRFIGSFEHLTIADVYTGISKLKTGTSTLGEPFKQNTLAPGLCYYLQGVHSLDDRERIQHVARSQNPETPDPTKDTTTKTAAHPRIDSETTASNR